MLRPLRPRPHLRPLPLARPCLLIIRPRLRRRPQSSNIHKPILSGEPRRPKYVDQVAFTPPHTDLQNGAGQPSPWFSEVTFRRYEDAFVVTEVRPLVECLLSGPASDAATRESGDEYDRKVSDLTERLEKELASHSAIHITKDTGLFVAPK